jgi:hypothetical protein
MAVRPAKLAHIAIAIEHRNDLPRFCVFILFIGYVFLVDSEILQVLVVYRASADAKWIAATMAKRNDALVIIGFYFCEKQSTSHAALI